MIPWVKKKILCLLLYSPNANSSLSAFPDFNLILSLFYSLSTKYSPSNPPWNKLPFSSLLPFPLPIASPRVYPFRKEVAFPQPLSIISHHHSHLPGLATDGIQRLPWVQHSLWTDSGDPVSRCGGRQDRKHTFLGESRGRFSSPFLVPFLVSRKSKADIVPCNNGGETNGAVFTRVV